LAASVNILSSNTSVFDHSEILSLITNKMIMKTCEVANQSGTLKVLDIRHHGDDTSNLRDELVASLTRPVSFKTVPSILLWDDRGQRLFEDILACSQYYPFRAELALLNKYSDEMVAAVGQNRLVIELGAGYAFFPPNT
jgi:hypothetical protein